MRKGKIKTQKGIHTYLSLLGGSCFGTQFASVVQVVLKPKILLLDL